MGSIALDNGESVYIHDGTGDADPVAISALEGSSVAALMRNRERFDFTWADASERGAQTGMVQGSRGYQEDTKTEYLYDSSAWRLAIPYIEFSASTLAMSASTWLASSGWSVDATRSTDTTMVTVSGGVFTFVRAGIYSISTNAAVTTPGTTVFQLLSTDAAHLATVSIAGFVANVSTLNVPYRITADNTSLYLWAYNTSASDLSDRRVRIVRLG